MKRRFTAQVPQDVLSALKWGNPATYAEVFDHLAEKGAVISISKFYSIAEEGLLRDGWRARDYMFQGECNTMDMTCNAQAFISISRKRLCKGCPSPETRLAWEIVIDALREVDPILAEKCVPDCIYRGFCTEDDRCCGYAKTPAFEKKLEEYRRTK